MKKNDVTVLRDVFLFDPEQNEAHITSIEGFEMGHNHLRIYTQSRKQNEFGVYTMFEIYSKEVNTMRQPSKQFSPISILNSICYGATIATVLWLLFGGK